MAQQGGIMAGILSERDLQNDSPSLEFLLSFYVYKCVVAYMKMLFFRVLSSHKSILGSISSLNQCLSVTGVFGIHVLHVLHVRVATN